MREKAATSSLNSADATIQGKVAYVSDDIAVEDSAARLELVWRRRTITCDRSRDHVAGISRLANLLIRKVRESTVLALSEPVVGDFIREDVDELQRLTRGICDGLASEAMANGVGEKTSLRPIGIERVERALRITPLLIDAIRILHASIEHLPRKDYHLDYHLFETTTTRFSHGRTRGTRASIFLSARHGEVKGEEDNNYFVTSSIGLDVVLIGNEKLIRGFF